jgi:hypothetical protein
MDTTAARGLIDEAHRLFSTGRFQAAGAHCSSVISALPRTGAEQPELQAAYGLLMEAQVKEGRVGRAMRTFRQYVEDCAPPADAAYDEIYREGLLATHSLPTPLKRRDRFFLLTQLLQQTLPLEGLVAECGCYRGFSSYLLCGTLRRANPAFDGRGYRIFDSFAGLSAPQAQDAIDAADPNAGRLQQMTRAGHFDATLAQVRTALGAYPHIGYFPGWIPNAFPEEPGVRYRFVHLDVDLYEPTRDSLDYFYPQLVAGGMIVSDDYGWPGARKAIDEFCARENITFKTTPYDQAYLVRSA